MVAASIKALSALGRKGCDWGAAEAGRRRAEQCRRGPARAGLQRCTADRKRFEGSAGFKPVGRKGSGTQEVRFASNLGFSLVANRNFARIQSPSNVRRPRSPTQELVSLIIRSIPFVGISGACGPPLVWRARKPLPSALRWFSFLSLCSFFLCVSL